MPDNDPRDPRIELARKITKRDRVKPHLAGATTAGGSNPVAPVFNLPSGGSEGDVLTLVSGSLEWTASSGGGGTQHYWQYLWDIDGSGGWGFVEETISGQTYPVMELIETE